MDKKTLELEFKDVGDKSFNISLNNPVDNIDQQTLLNLESTIVSNKLFLGVAGDITKLASATVRTVSTNKIIG